MNLKRTALFPVHQKYNGRMVDFGGWELPIQYESIIKEHHMVRKKAGLFDVSHMGEIEVHGEKAEAFLQYLLSNDINKIAPGQVQYNIMCYPDGGVVDDLLVYKYTTEHYLLVVNAANTDKDFEWIKKNAFPGVEIENLSDDYAQMAIQGPLAEQILQKLTDFELHSIKYYWFQANVEIAGKTAIISRTGYTGEDGFEIYLSPADAIDVWEAILEAGGEDIAPIGLGARDSLRFEAKLPLYGQELGPDISPLEARLGIFVKFDCGDFIGREALLRQKESQPPRVQAELLMLERGIPRSHYEVCQEGKVIGQLSSGGLAPSLEKNLALALVDREYYQPGAEVEVMIRNKPVKAQIVTGAFYRKKTQAS